ncbi:MAG: hypothetical protein AAF840_09325 [Bacteroidota bacterium]
MRSSVFTLSLVFCFLVVGKSLSAQNGDFRWWDELHNWDGFTPWQNYLIIAPGFLGPNALPVPDVKNGQLLEGATFKFGAEQHLSTGDNTSNLFTEGFIPLFSDRVGLNLQWVPFETYRMDIATRNLRRIRDFDGEGTATGDLYLGTYIQLLHNHAKLPDVVLTINLKTASGDRLTAGRFTDAPGYFFDLSLGRDYAFQRGFIQSIRPHLMGGFYVWQRFESNALQNDSFLYGGGFDLKAEKFTLTNTLAGYIGYLDDGDKPMVYRLICRSHFQSALNYEFRFQLGLNDFDYTSFRLLGVYRFGHGHRDEG